MIKYEQGLWLLNMGRETPRDPNSVEKVNLHGSNIHYSTKFRCKMNSQKQLPDVFCKKRCS